MRIRRIGVALALLSGLLATMPGAVTASAKTASSPQNVVLILTDDQRWDTVQYMPEVESQLVSNGVTFTNSFDNNPLCCPSRATILTGQTSGHNGVWWNVNGPIGGFQSFEPHAQENVLRWVHDAGYTTALVGKFLNGYAFRDIPWILPGVDSWDAFLLDRSRSVKSCQSPGYFSTCYSHDGTLEKHGPTDYSTTTSGAKAVGFIDSAPADQPLFLYYAPRAPHGPTTPEPAHATDCPEVQPLRPPSYNKLIKAGPAYMEALPKIHASRAAAFDRRWVDSCRTLLSVDTQVSNIIQALRDTNRLDNTLILYASDNGFLFGEHRWKGKIVPYEESARVPVIIRDDAIIPEDRRGTQVSDLITNMDYTATFLDAAGVSPPVGYQMDGQSLLPLVGGAGLWKPETGILIEHAGGNDAPAYCGIRVNNWMFAHYSTGEEELYDLSTDPNELINVAGRGANAVELATLRQQTIDACVPTPPGFAW